jgi:hypothetical protein
MQKLSTLAKKSKTNQNKLEMKQRSIFQTKKPITICDNCQKNNN